MGSITLAAANGFLVNIQILIRLTLDHDLPPLNLELRQFPTLKRHPQNHEDRTGQYTMSKWHLGFVH